MFIRVLSLAGLLFLHRLTPRSFVKGIHNSFIFIYEIATVCLCGLDLYNHCCVVSSTEGGLQVSPPPILLKIEIGIAADFGK